MTVLAFKMSRYANGVSALHGRITRKSWQVLWPHHREDEVPVGHITNGVHVRTWLAPGDAGPLHRSTSAPTGASTWPTRRCGRASTASPTPSCGRPTACSRRRWSTSSAAASPSSGGATATPTSSIKAAAQRARSRGADHRLRAPLRDLQARQPDLQRHRRGSSGCSPIRSAPCSWSSRARRTRPIARARRSCARCTTPTFTAELQEQRHLHRGLRHQRRAPPGAGGRRLAQQPAPPAGGERHQRPEGAAQRRAQLLGARRLVGRGLRRPQRLRDRRRRHPRHRSTSRTGATRRRSTRRWRTRSSRSTTIATTRACRAAGSSG